MTSTTEATRPRPLERAQALVETALVLVVLILLLGGILDLGRAYFTYLALHNAAGEGALYGSSFPLREAAGPNDPVNRRFPDPDNISYRARHEVPADVAGAQLVDWTAATVTVSYSVVPNPTTGAEPGSTITVRVEAPFEMIGPLPGLMGWNATFPIAAEARQTILTDGLD